MLHILCTVQWKLAVQLVGTALHRAQQHLVVLFCDKQSFGLLQTAVAIKQYICSTTPLPLFMWQYTSWSEWLPPLPIVWPRNDVYFSGNSTQGETTILSRFYCPALFASLYPTFHKVDRHKTLSVWIRNRLDVTLCYPLFLLYKLLNMFRATMCPSSWSDDCVVLSSRVGVVPWLQEGCQNRFASSVSIEEFVATNSSMDTLPADRFWQPSCSHGTTPTRDDNTTQSSDHEDGHMVARNMLSNL